MLGLCTKLISFDMHNGGVYGSCVGLEGQEGEKLVMQS